MTRPRKNPGASGIGTRDLPLFEADALTTRPTRRCREGVVADVVVAAGITTRTVVVVVVLVTVVDGGTLGGGIVFG